MKQEIFLARAPQEVAVCSIAGGAAKWMIYDNCDFKMPNRFQRFLLKKFCAIEITPVSKI